MTSTKEMGKSAITDLKGTLGSFLETLETESNRLREQAETESSQIIAEAEEKAGQILEQAREEARQEADHIIAQARQEAVEFVDGIKEKMSQAITEVVENTVTRARDDLTRYASEVRSELDSETSGKSTKQSDVKNRDKTDAKVFQGRVKVEIVSPFYNEQPPGMEDELTRIPGVKILSTNSYARGNSQITAHTVELAEPMPLLETIKSVTQAKDVAEQAGNILITVD